MFEQSILDIADDRSVFSSGGYRGDLALLVKQGMLRLLVQRITENMKWEVTVDVSNHGAKWIHVSGTWALGGVANLYLDGALSSTGNGETISSYQPPPPKMYVEKLNSAGGYTKFFLDEWYFWDRELRVDQVAQVYAAYQTGTRSFQTILVFNIFFQIWKSLEITNRRLLYLKIL